jgi:hypothetical protein
MYKTPEERMSIYIARSSERVREVYEEAVEEARTRKAKRIRAILMWANILFWPAAIGALWFAVGGA